MAFTVPKKVPPEWMKPSPLLVEKIEQAAKLQGQIDAVMGANTLAGAMYKTQLAAIKENTERQRMFDEVIGGATGRMTITEATRQA